ncbi:MAG TPA: NifU family protein [Bacilli bacterium]|nr:NifU family protein [Bacilli bacterium]
MTEQEKHENHIKLLLGRIRPYLQSHGGDIEFVSFEDGFVYVKMKGACDGCAYVDQTLEFGIEELLMEEVPGVLGIILVD